MIYFLGSIVLAASAAIFDPDGEAVLRPFLLSIIGNRQKRFRLSMIVLALLAWVLFVIVIPPFQTPDEPGHFAYVQSLASGHYPILPKKGILSYDSDLSADLQISGHVSEIAFHQDRIMNFLRSPVDESKSDNVDKSVQAYQPPLYYFVASVLYRVSRSLGLPALTNFYATRMASLLFYLLFLAAFRLTVGQFMKQRAADYLTLAIALQPTLLMIAASINPEIGVVAVFTVTLGFLVAGLKTGSTKLSYAILLGLLSAATILTKFTGVIIYPVIFLALAMETAGGKTKKMRQLATYTASTIIPLTPWLIFNYLNYHALLPHNAQLLSGSGPIDNKIQLLFMTSNDIRESLSGLAGIFGWLDAPVYGTLQQIYTFICLTFIGIGAWIIFHRREWKKSGLELVPFISFVTLALLSLFLIVYSLYLKVDYGWIFALQPRYFMIGMLPAAVLFVSGIRQALRSVHEEQLMRGLFFFSLVYFLIALLYTIVPRYYV